MKKNIVSLLLCGAVLAGMSMSACATEGAAEVDYSMMDDTVYEGEWLTILDTFDLYLPLDWDILLDAGSEDEAQNGIYFMVANEDQTISASVSYALTDMTSLDQEYDALVEAGMDNVDYVYVNGIPCVNYEVSADGVYSEGLAALDDEGNLYNLTVGCDESIADEADPIMTNIMLSFSEPEAAEVETEA